jgi:hypothetical protein
MSIRSRSRADPGLRSPAPVSEPVSAGEYFHSERRLYRVEETDGERALIEDCLTGVLIDIDVGRLLDLDRVLR